MSLKLEHQDGDSVNMWVFKFNHKHGRIPKPEEFVDAGFASIVARDAISSMFMLSPAIAKVKTLCNEYVDVLDFFISPEWPYDYFFFTHDADAVKIKLLLSHESQQTT